MSDKADISKKVNNQQQIIDFLKKSIGRKPISKRYVRKINKLGKNILLITYKKIEKLI